MNFGYRARYIQQAIKYLKYTVNDPSYFDQLKSQSVGDARTQLLKIMGVGRKVTDSYLSSTKTILSCGVGRRLRSSDVAGKTGCRTRRYTYTFYSRAPLRSTKEISTERH